MATSEKSIKVIQGIVNVEDVQSFLKKWKDVVFLNADYIVDENHAYFAAEKAIKAWKEGRRVAKSLPMEIILYAAATRQINKAITLGLSKGINKVVAILLNSKYENELKNILKEFKMEINKEKIDKILKFFEITQTELDTAGINKLNLIVRERIVLFDIFK